MVDKVGRLLKHQLQSTYSGKKVKKKPYSREESKAVFLKGKCFGCGRDQCGICASKK